MKRTTIATATQATATKPLTVARILAGHPCTGLQREYAALFGPLVTVHDTLNSVGGNHRYRVYTEEGAKIVIAPFKEAAIAAVNGTSAVQVGGAI